MRDASPLRDFPVSQKIYAHLLRAYPKAHRVAYGAAMAQLFRDQCRAAWGDSRHWGLGMLWLRVLPDLLSTSILERLAALKERKSMTDNLANLSGFRATPARTFFRVFVPVFVLVFGASVAITFLLPEMFASTARIKVEPAPPSGQANSPITYDPYLLQSEFEVMQSTPVLARAAEKLNLDVIWGKKYNGGQPLKTYETLAFLRARLELRPVRNTSLVEVRVFSEDRTEAARLANAVAEAYHAYQKERIQQISAGTDRLPVIATEIVDPAVPGSTPVRPNKPLNITLGAVTGILLASIAGAFGALIVYLLRKRMRPATPTP